MGPGGTLKMIVSGTGHVQVTSSSARLWTLIQCDQVLAEFILQSVKHLQDHKLFSSSLAARLLTDDNFQSINMGKILVSIRQYLVQVV